MKLNLEFYNDTNEPISEDVKNIIENYIDKYEEKDYFKNLGDTITDKEMYYLSNISSNILNWYPFTKEDSVLEIGGDLGQLTGELSKKCKEVVSIEPNLIKAKAIEKRLKQRDNIEIIVGNLENIKINKRFNYIVLIGIDTKIKELAGKNVKLEEFLKSLEQLLELDGKILLAVDNKFGIRFFAGEQEKIFEEKFSSLYGYSSKDEYVESFTKNSLDLIFKKNGLYSNYFYPLPDYRLPNVLFSDKSLPDYHTFERYVPYHTENASIILEEMGVFREILKENKDLFTFFTNSFFVELSKSNVNQKYNYISFNNLRKKEYRLITKIADDHVEKEMIDEKSKLHYETIKANMKILEEHNLKSLDYIKDGKIESKYIEQEFRFDKVLSSFYKEKNIEKFEGLFQKYKDILFNNTLEISEYENTIFAKYGVELENKEILKEFHFKKNGLWDMIFQNCFYIDDELYFFDQEWNDENVPTEFILYRSIYYTLPLRKTLYDEKDVYGLNKYIKLFEELDRKIQKYLYDEKMCNFYYRDKKYDLDATKQEISNLNLRMDAMQAAFDNLKKDYDELVKTHQNYVNKIQSLPVYKVYKLFKKGK